MPEPTIQAEIDLSLASFRFNQAELDLLLRGEHGEVAKDLSRRAIKVVNQAKQNASQPPPSVPGHGPSVRTGRLRGSITWRLDRDSEGLFTHIGSAVLYAPYVEFGTSRMAARPFLVPALQAGR